MTGRRRIGVFGGAFDPPHIGHLVVAHDVIERLSLDTLVVVPTGRPVHRETTLPGPLRLKLVELAFAGAERVEVSAIEFDRNGPSYMVDTLEELSRKRPDADWCLVIGSDQYAAFDTWKNPERILELSRLAVMQRGGEAIKPDPRYPFEEVKVTRIDLSAEAVRERMALGQSIRYLVPEPVFRALESNSERLIGSIEVC